MERRTLLRAAVIGGPPPSAAACGAAPRWRTRSARHRAVRAAAGRRRQRHSASAGFTSRVVARSGRRSPAPRTPGTTPRTAGRASPTAPAGSTSPTPRSTRRRRRVARSSSPPRARSSPRTGSCPAPARTAPAARRRGTPGCPARRSAAGYVYETDPQGGTAAVQRPALGRFKHEAAAADPVRKVVYLTEDETDGRFYRFVPPSGATCPPAPCRCWSPAPATIGLVHLGDGPRPGRLADRDPHPGLRREVVQRRRGLLLRRRHRAGSPPRATTGSGSVNLAAEHIRAGVRRLAGDRGHGPADRRGQHHRHRLRRPLRRRGRRQHGDLPDHPGRGGRRRSCGSPGSPRLGDHRSGVLPDGGRLYFSSQRGTGGALGRRHHLRGDAARSAPDHAHSRLAP